MVESISKMIRKDEDTVLFLADIGVWAFRELLDQFSDRVMNIGIFEDGMISVAAGMALRGIVPTIYGITPFILERALEQLKLDFGYQNLEGNFITTGAAYDFSTLGYSHYCAEDVGILKMLPEFEIITPGHPKEFEILFDACKRNGKPTYFRLSDFCNSKNQQVEFGKATVIKKGNKATIIVISTMLDIVLESCINEDVTILYYTTLEPFDKETLLKFNKTGKILLCEPHYQGSILSDIIDTFDNRAVQVKMVGIPKKILRSYGTKAEKDINLNITSEHVYKSLNELMRT